MPRELRRLLDRSIVRVVRGVVVRRLARGEISLWLREALRKTRVRRGVVKGTERRRVRGRVGWSGMSERESEVIWVLELERKVVKADRSEGVGGA